MLLSIIRPVGVTELEESYNFSKKTTTGKTSYAPDYARRPTSQVIDQDLAEVVAAWRWLPDATKAEVSRLVRAALAEEGRK